MTTTQEPLTNRSATEEHNYPTLLRIGHKYVTTLGQRLAVGGFRGPQDIAVSPDGSYYVLNRGSANLQQVPRTRYIRVNLGDEGYENDIVPKIDDVALSQGDDRLPSPVMCVLDSAGTLFNTDERANAVVAINTSGETIGMWGKSGDEPGQLNGPAGISLDADENLWVVNSRDHRVQHFTRDGKYLGGFGDFGTAPGQLNYPWGISVDPVDGSLVVADWHNSRVQRFSTDGTVIQIIGSPGAGVGELDHP